MRVERIKLSKCNSISERRIGLENPNISLFGLCSLKAANYLEMPLLISIVTKPPSAVAQMWQLLRSTRCCVVERVGRTTKKGREDYVSHSGLRADCRYHSITTGSALSRGGQQRH